MFDCTKFARTTAAAAALAVLSAAPAAAQAWTYPTFQQPRVTSREFNFAVADGAGTSLLFQWREGIGMSGTNQLSLDAGYVDPDYRGADGAFLLGAQFAHQIMTSNANTPLDLLFTAGANVAFFEPSSLIRIPVGASLGHRFPLESGMAITPYIHPRLSIDHCSDCVVKFENGQLVTDGDTDVGFDFDLGGSFEFTPNLAVRLSASLGGSDYLADDDSFGVSFAWTPGMPARRR
jgi:opacity protein-like surface antigen